MTTLEKYSLYESLLLEWDQKMNLVAKSTLTDIRKRHIDDSAQLAKFIPLDKIVIDLGSGAGFPSVVLAILGYKVWAIESIGKKSRFLETVKEKLDLPNLEIVNERVEKAVPKIVKNAQIRHNLVFTARAFAPLIKILNWTGKFGIPYVLLKGRDIGQEIAESQRIYGLDVIDVIKYPSETGDGFVIKLTMK